MHPRDRQILKIALPSIVSNITVPLLGLVDVTIVGHLGAAAYIGAIAVGGMLFNIIYWLFAFLRMGTGGMTSQAFGARNLPEVMRLLLRSVLLGMGLGLLFILLQVPLRELALYLIAPPTAEVAALTRTYFNICIYGAPAMLGLYGLTGWFLGMQNSRSPMWVAIVQNVVNIACSLLLVYGFGMKVEGVALGTLIAQYAGFLTALFLLLRYYRRLMHYLPQRLLSSEALQNLWNRKAMSRFFSVNRNIFLRTLCLVSVTLFFTSAGAAQGEVVLAVNTLLMQLFTLYSYIMDGFAFAGEALSGRYIGARHAEAFYSTVRRLFGWGGVMALLFTLTYALGGEAFLRLLTSEEEVIAASATYFPWALLIPLCGLAAFIWDGIYIGATATRGMLISMAVATLTFFLLYAALHATWGNHALWLSFLAYLTQRGLVQTLLRKQVYHKIT